MAPVNCDMHLLCFLKLFFTPGIRFSRLIQYLCCSRPGICHLFKESQFLSVGMVLDTKTWALSEPIATGIFFLLSPFSYTYTNIHTYMHIHIHAYVQYTGTHYAYMHKLVYINISWVYSNISNSNPSPKGNFLPSPFPYLYVPSSTVRTLAPNNISTFIHLLNPKSHLSCFRTALLILL